MAGKLCGPSSSKASPASTPIPLGTAKHKILKSNDKYYTYSHTLRARTRAPHTHVHVSRTDCETHEYLRQKYLARKSARLPAKAFTLKQTGTKERQGKKTGKRVNTETRERERKYRARKKKNETEMEIERRDLMVLRWKSSTTHLLSLSVLSFCLLLIRIEIDRFLYSSVVTLKSA